MAAMPDTPPPARSPCARVLVVDDDEMMCQFLERMLERRGFTVFSETSPREAIERLTHEDFDVVVSDLNMEGLDGMAFNQRVIELRPDTPVILITGDGMMEVAIRAVQAGAWDFLHKPIDPKLLALSIERACSHRQLKKELRALRTLVNGSDGTPVAGAC